MASKCDDSAHSLLFDIVALGHYIGPRLSKYAQTTQDKVNYHTYPSGHQVIKAFIDKDYVFYDSKKCILKDLTLGIIVKACTIQIMWRIQNGQSLKLATDVKHPGICPVCSALRIAMRAQRLGQLRDSPVGVYKSKRGKIFYPTGNKIAELLWAAVCEIRPDMSKEELKRYSAHSVHVWECVLLDEAGKSPEYIKKQLRWLGNSFRMYLRDTPTEQGIMTPYIRKQISFSSANGQPRQCWTRQH